MKMFRVALPEVGGRQSIICPTADAVAVILSEDSEVGDTFEVEAIELTTEEYEKLPEHDGW